VARLYFVRHAKAGSRSHWVGDDRLRPLSKKGVQQAEALIKVLAPFAVESIHSSPYLRCVQTVAPLARARRISVGETTALAEGAGLQGAMKLVNDLQLDDAVLSTHGDVVWELVEELAKRRLVKASDRGFEKGSTWVVEVEDGVLEGARFIPAP
jgi:broad specificity phosphatase PhoE